MKSNHAQHRQGGPLTTEDIAYLASTADVQYYAARTPGLAPMSRPERLLVLGVLVSMGLLYVHLEVRPFIPFDLPEVPRWLVTVLFAAAAIDVIILIGVLGLLVYSGILLLRNRVFPPQVYTTCPDCVALTPVGRYLEGQGCKHCGGRRVYCRNCGKASDVSNFLPGGSGCPQCGHAQFAIR